MYRDEPNVTYIVLINAINRMYIRKLMASYCDSIAIDLIKKILRLKRYKKY